MNRNYQHMVGPAGTNVAYNVDNLSTARAGINQNGLPQQVGAASRGFFGTMGGRLGRSTIYAHGPWNGTMKMDRADQLQAMQYGSRGYNPSSADGGNNGIYKRPEYGYTGQRQHEYGSGNGFATHGAVHRFGGSSFNDAFRRSQSIDNAHGPGDLAPGGGGVKPTPLPPKVEQSTPLPTGNTGTVTTGTGGSISSPKPIVPVSTPVRSTVANPAPAKMMSYNQWLASKPEFKNIPIVKKHARYDAYVSAFNRNRK